MKKFKVWIDEAWRWPWLWPVVSCALCFDDLENIDKSFLSMINDSKKLSEKKREELFKKLIDMSLWEKPRVYFWVWVVDNFLIDEINIRQANKEAMRRAILELQRKISKENIATVMIDWNDNYEFVELKKKAIFVIWWDSKILEIWAASIIAKVFRDNLIKTYSLLYPDMNLENHKWYGTKKHIEYLNKKEKITWIHRLSYKPVKKILEEKEKLLLHICCWPDATVPIMDLKKDYEITCFWYDPNIQPKKEYDKRLEAFKKVCKIEKVKFIEWDYEVKQFFEKIKWLEHTPEKWEKCTLCYDMRLEKTANLARELWIKYWTTTLNISPHKDLEKLFKIWDNYSVPHPSPLLTWEGTKEKLEFLKIAFRKNNWFLRSVEYTKKHNIYRQNYCGCVYSDTFPNNEKND